MSAVAGSRRLAKGLETEGKSQILPFVQLTQRLNVRQVLTGAIQAVNDRFVGERRYGT